MELKMDLGGLDPDVFVAAQLAHAIIVAEPGSLAPPSKPEDYAAKLYFRCLEALERERKEWLGREK